MFEDELNNLTNRELTEFANQLIKAIQLQLQITRSDIAQYVGISASYLSKISNDISNPKKDVKIKYIISFFKSFRFGNHFNDILTNTQLQIFRESIEDDMYGKRILSTKKISSNKFETYSKKYNKQKNVHKAYKRFLLVTFQENKSRIDTHYLDADFSNSIITIYYFQKENSNIAKVELFVGELALISQNERLRDYSKFHKIDKKIFTLIPPTNFEKNSNKEILFGSFTSINKKDVLISGEYLLLNTDISLSPHLEILKYYFTNKEIHPSAKLAKSFADFIAKIEEFSSTQKDIRIKIPKELTTAYDQFLSFFTDYVEIAKGKDIQFDVLKGKESLEIKMKSLDESINITQIGEYLNEYLGFAKANLDNLKVPVETDLSENEFNVLVLDLKGQVNHLKHCLEIAYLKNNFLEQSNDYLKQLTTKLAEKDTQITTQIFHGGEQQVADKIKNK